MVTYGILWGKVDVICVEVLDEGSVHGEGEVSDLNAARLIGSLLPVLLFRETVSRDLSFFSKQHISEQKILFNLACVFFLNE
jgi:hypothetical protein